MIPANSENVFVGASVVKGKEKYNVYKVNSSTLWAGTSSTETVLSAWDDRAKGTKWLEFMNSVQAVKLNVSSLMIDETNTALKNRFNKSKEKKEGRLKKCCYKELDTLNKAFEKKKAYRYPVQCNCGKDIFIVKAEEDGRFWVRAGLDYIYYNPETNEEEYIRTVGDSKMPEVS
jgi:hypothetical protein